MPLPSKLEVTKAHAPTMVLSPRITGPRITAFAPIQQWFPIFNSPILPALLPMMFPPVKVKFSPIMDFLEIKMSLRILFDRTYPNLRMISKKRFKWLKELAGKGSVLIIGSGDKCEFYRNKFRESLLINSDVHNQFGVDIVFDAHNIPFKDNTFQLVYSSQVLEHTLQPWVVSKEINRVTKTGGFIHTEVPFCFPYHGQPYDFYRFTPEGLRLLFQQCELVRDEVISGGGSSSAYMLSESMINKFSGRYTRIISLFLTRFLLFWLKYTEYFDPTESKRRVGAAMNIAQTFKKDLMVRSSKDMLEEIRLRFA